MVVLSKLAVLATVATLAQCGPLNAEPAAKALAKDATAQAAKEVPHTDKTAAKLPSEASKVQVPT